MHCVMGAVRMTTLGGSSPDKMVLTFIYRLLSPGKAVGIHRGIFLAAPGPEICKKQSDSGEPDNGVVLDEPVLLVNRWEERDKPAEVRPCPVHG